MFDRTDSVGQQRMAALHGGTIPSDVRDLEIHPNLWAGLGLVRPGPGTAIVGSPETVLDTIQQYRDAGIGTFIVSGFPLLEEGVPDRRDDPAAPPGGARPRRPARGRAAARRRPPHLDAAGPRSPDPMRPTETR